MDIKQRAFSSINLNSAGSQGVLNPPWAGGGPVRARSTTSLVGPQNNPRNRALSWSPVRFDAPAKVSCLPWARRDAQDVAPKKNSIDGSVLKARQVWEEKAVANVSKDSVNPENDLLKKGVSVSFRHQKSTAVVAPMLKRNSTGSSLQYIPSQVLGNSARLREKNTSAANETNMQVISQRRQGFVRADSDEVENVSEVDSDRNVNNSSATPFKDVSYFIFFIRNMSL